MSTTLTALGLYKSAQISLPLLKAGFKILRDNVLSSATESEWEKSLQDILGHQVDELLKGRIETISLKQLEEADAPLITFTGLVLQSLVKDVLESDDFTSVSDLFTTALPQVPRRWKTFVIQGVKEAQPLNGTDFLNALQFAQKAWANLLLCSHHCSPPSLANGSEGKLARFPSAKAGTKSFPKQLHP